MYVLKVEGGFSEWREEKKFGIFKHREQIAGLAISIIPFHKESQLDTIWTTPINRRPLKFDIFPAQGEYAAYHAQFMQYKNGQIKVSVSADRPPGKDLRFYPNTDFIRLMPIHRVNLFPSDGGSPIESSQPPIFQNASYDDFLELIQEQLGDDVLKQDKNIVGVLFPAPRNDRPYQHWPEPFRREVGALDEEEGGFELKLANWMIKQFSYLLPLMKQQAVEFDQRMERVNLI